MNANLIWSLVLAVVGIIGLYLAGSGKGFGWLFGLAAQVLWVIFAIVTRQYGFLLTAIAYGWVYSRNYIRYRRAQPKRVSKSFAQNYLD